MDLSVVCWGLSIVNCQLFVVSCLLSIVSGPLPVLCCEPDDTREQARDIFIGRISKKMNIEFSSNGQLTTDNSRFGTQESALPGTCSISA